jgi:hypothetical protein
MLDDGPASASMDSPAARLLTTARVAFLDGRLDEAVMAAEALYELAFLEGDSDARRRIAGALAVLDRIFTERLGDFSCRVAAGQDVLGTAPANFTESVRQLLALADGRITLADLIERSSIPRRDAVRLIACLLRRRALVVL